MKHLLLILSTLFLSCSFSFAQNIDRTEQINEKKISRRQTKKEITAERDSLLTVVKNLKLELDSIYAFENMIAIADTTIIDTLNPGPDYLTIFELDTATVNRDSLLSMWYHKRDLSLLDMEPSNIDSLELISNIPDSIYLERLKNMNLYISLPYNKAIKNHIIYYTEKMPDKMEKILGLADYYMPLIEQIFDLYDLPYELKAMAVIESALNTKAVSRVGAKGMWQFMYTTAKRYGLTINSYVDERYDPIASAHAAAKYLRDSYLIFGDWPLAIASYNCGAGNVNKAIRRSGGSKDFWEIYPFLPRETRGYVPSFFAALYTMTYYKEHNLRPQQVVMPPHLDTITVKKMLHFEQIAHYTGISIDELRTHNPQYIHDIIPGGLKPYTLCLPYNYTDKFIEHENEIYSYKDSVYFSPSNIKKIKEGVSTSSTRIIHKVRKGQTLSHIALKYGVSVRKIQQWNGIGTRIRVGQRLVIYTNGKGPSSSSSSSKSVNTSTSGGYIYYTVRKGDTLWDIAKKFPGVTTNSLMRINGFSNNSKIYPGKKIKIKKAN